MKNLSLICKELEAKGKNEAADCIERLAEKNMELGDMNADMLEALEYLLTRLDSIEDIRIAQEAIAKAKGENG